MQISTVDPNERPSKPGRGRGCLRLAGKALLAALALLIALTPVGLAYQARALRLDRERYPPPGRLVTVDGFRLHIVCAGEGAPTVVFEAGLGDASYIWERVTAGLAGQVRVCAYDRPGLGWSDFVRRPFDRNAVAENLHTLLANAEIPGPYVLVGHSIGGVYIRAYAHKYPQEVAGMVFVDSAHENQTGRMSSRRSRAMGGMLDRMLSLCEVVAPTGVFRVFGLGQALMEDTGLSEDTRRAAAATLNRSTYCRTIANELNTSDVDTSLPDPPAGLGDIPLAALAAGQDFGGPQGSPTPAPGSPATGLGGGRWLRLQQQLAGLSTRGRLVVAEQSGHYIHLDQPELVIQAIIDVVNEVRGTN